MSILRVCSGFAVLLAGTAGSSRQPAATYDVDAIRYATVAGFPVRGLVAGADTSRRMDIAMAVWLILYGLTGLVAFALPGQVMTLLALVAGVLLLVGR